MLKIIDEYRNDIVTHLRNLVRFPSLGGHEKEAQLYVADLLRKMGLQIDVWEPKTSELASHPAFIKTPWGYEGRPNVVGVLKGHGNGRSLILNGHIDVVSPEPVSAWKHDPFGGEVENGYLYGRGALDMKGSIVAMIYAVKSIINAGIKLKGDVIIESVIEEECGGPGGTLSTILRGYRADGVIITEPTGLDSIWVNCPGVLWFRVKVLGKPAHAGYAHLGVNAIGKILKIYEALLSLDEFRVEKTRKLIGEENPRPVHINIGTIRGGDWPSTVAGWAEMECRISFQYPEPMEAVKEEVENQVKLAAELDPWMREHPPTVEWFGFHAEAAATNKESPIIQALAEKAEQITGKKPRTSWTSVGHDQRHFVLYGKMPNTILYGPGGSGIHSTDECVSIEDCIDLAKTLALTIIEWCGIADREK